MGNHMDMTSRSKNNCLAWSCKNQEEYITQFPPWVSFLLTQGCFSLPLGFPIALLHGTWCKKMSTVVDKCQSKKMNNILWRSKQAANLEGKKKRLVNTRFVKSSDEQLIGLHQVGSISYTVR